MKANRVSAAAGARWLLEGLRVLRAAPLQLMVLHLALLLGELGRLDEAFEQLDRAIAVHDPSLVHLAVAPQWDCLRGDPRFSQRLRALGL